MQINTKSPYYIGEDEYDRITYVISEADFNTAFPNPNRIEKTIRGINDYLRYKMNKSKNYM